jgi:hypothetical protein
VRGSVGEHLFAERQEVVGSLVRLDVA